MAQVKICGLTRPEHVAAAVDAGAAFVRAVEIGDFARQPRKVEHLRYSGKNVIFRDQISKTTSEELVLLSLPHPKH